MPLKSVEGRENHIQFFAGARDPRLCQRQRALNATQVNLMKEVDEAKGLCAALELAVATWARYPEMEQAERQEFEESMTRMWVEDDRRRLPERPASLGDGQGLRRVPTRRRSRSPSRSPRLTSQWMRNQNVAWRGTHWHGNQWQPSSSSGSRSSGSRR